MGEPGLVAIFSLAFSLGVLHALDADHVMAVSGLASGRPGFRQSFRFCLRWAIGHGLSLLLIGSAVLLLGMTIPAELSAVAEGLVGIVLIGIGGWVLHTLFMQKAHFHFHSHDNLSDHAHWHVHEDHPVKEQPEHIHDHSAVMVGVLHGIAGSAPLLALIPLTQMDSSWLGMGYLILFGLGVLVSMMVFSGVLGGVFTWLSAWGNRLVRVVRTGVAISAIGFGGYLIQGTW